MRLGPGRRPRTCVRRLVVVTSLSIAITLVVAGFAGAGTPNEVPRSGPLPHRFLDRRRDLSVRLPAGWYVHRRPLTQLVSPRQLLAVSSYRIHQRGLDSNCTPRTAIR